MFKNLIKIIKASKKIKIILSILGGIALCGTSAVIINSIINDKETNIKVSELNYIEPLTEANEVQAAKLVKENIVRITNTVDDAKVIGTGFFIKEGYIVTNSHVVDILGEVEIEYYDGTKSKAYLYSNSIEYDIALLKVESPKVKALTLGSSNSLEVTNDLFAAGYIYNFAGEASISKGILSSRRTSNLITYLQSDISIDTGSSGGPLFNAKAEVVGINTYTTETRTFALSLSSESLSMIIKILLDDPITEYLTDKRPANLINEILVEVGYTEDEDFELYGDDEIINKSKDIYDDKLSEIESSNQNNYNNYKEEYTCPDGYYFVGRKCVKETSYASTKNYDACKDEYVLDGEFCKLNKKVPVETRYYCTSENMTLDSNNKCIFEGYITGSFTDQIRYGSCPTGKKCFNIGNQNNSGISFIQEATCPSGSTTVTNGTYIWNGEEMIEGNYKTFNQVAVYGKLKSTDSNGQTYYQDSTGIYIAKNCAKKQDSTTGVYTFYTEEELKNTACPTGAVLTKSVTSNGIQGFYCRLNENPNVYVYDIACYDADFEIYQEKEGTDVVCRKWVVQEYQSISYPYCEESYSREGDYCVKTDHYIATYTRSCNDGDELSGETCLNRVMADPIKK